MSRGYVYILTNEAMPGLVKIGRTVRCPDGRAKELYQTGVPFPFEVFASFQCPDCEELELMAHNLLADCRVNEGREFFLCDTYKAEQLVRDAHREQVECWMADYLPDHCIEHVDNMIDCGGFKPSFYDAVSEASIAPPDISEVIHELEGFEIQEAIKRHKVKSAARMEAYLARPAEEGGQQ